MTVTWLPRLACPDCRVEVERPSPGSSSVCGACGAAFEERDGVYRCLSKIRAHAAESFEQQYRLVRTRDGFCPESPDYYRRLPLVTPGDRNAGVWRIRRESFAHLLDRASRLSKGRALRILDLGAGNGWLSHRLAEAGHHPVAVDRLDDPADGLGACRHYPVRFPAVQADFDALPLVPSQFDLVVFDGSLHYSPDPASTLAEARRMLGPSGAIVVMDSPMFARANDGEAMLKDERRRMTAEYGLVDPVRPGAGFLTFAALDRATEAMGLRGRFIPSRGPIVWRLKRRLAQFRLGRAPAAFGMWVAQ
jgi:SAM-dependent methyltransferase